MTAQPELVGEAWQRALLDGAATPLCVVDSEERLTYVNAAFCELLGREREALLGRPAAELCGYGEDPLLLRELLRGKRERGRTVRSLRPAGGREVHVLVQATAVRGEGGVDAVVVVLADLAGVSDPDRRLAEQEELFVALTRNASDAAIVADAEGTIVYATTAVDTLFGYRSEDVLGTNGYGFVHPDDVEATRSAVGEVLATGGSRTVQFRILAADGGWRWAEETVTNLLHTSVGGLVGNLTDITRRVEAEQALRRSEAHYRAIAEAAQEGIWVARPDGTTDYVNSTMGRLLGVPVEQVLDRPVTDFFEPSEARYIATRLQGRAARGPERYEASYRHPDGSTRIFAASAAPIQLGPEGMVGSIAMITDVTEARAAEEQLRHAALHDALTGLPNRALLLDRVERALARAAPDTGLALLLVDLDQFKLVNDSRGHDAGDAVLGEVGRRLRALADATDTVARLGGDEFVLLREGASAEQVMGTAQAVLACLAQPLAVGEQLVRLSASIGVASVPPATGEDLLRFADTAMFAAKAAGRGQVRVFTPELAEEAERRFTLTGELRRALDEGALSLHYQPLVELASGRVLGVEALARWTHPRLGEVTPGVFVPLAAELGLAAELDRWAVTTAVRDVAALRAAGRLGPQATVTVNLSVRSLDDSELIPTVVNAVTAAQLPPRALALEVTEGALVGEPALAVLRGLHRRGFGVAVDDFGTGYSSLSYLRSLPVSTLKIDRSFVADLAEDENARAVVTAVIDLARALGLHTVAEGVETPEQARALRQLGCDSGQGWLWSPALPLRELLAGRCPPAYAPVRLAASERDRAGLEAAALPEPVLRRILALHRDGSSPDTIAAALNREGTRTPAGLRWHRSSVLSMLAALAGPAG